MLPGKLKYSVDKILLNNLKEHNIHESDLLTHDECLHLLTLYQNNQRNASSSSSSLSSSLTASGGNESVKENISTFDPKTLNLGDNVICVKTNYAWVFKNVNELNYNERCPYMEKGNKMSLVPGSTAADYISNIVENHKILIIPPLRLLGQRSFLGNRQMFSPDIFGRSLNQTILLDKFAHYFELILYLVECGEMTEKEKSCKVSTLIIRNKSTEIEIDMNDLCIKYNVSFDYLQARVNRNIKYIRTMCSIPLLNDKPSIFFLQGRESEIRNAIAKKVYAFRAQVVGQPPLQAHQVMVPSKWTASFPHLVYDHYGQCNLTLCNFCRQSLLTRQIVTEVVAAQSSHKIRVYDPSLLNDEVPPEYHYRLHGALLIMKRDPVINLASFSAHNVIIFTDGNLFRVCLELMERKAEDIDGDSEIAKYIEMNVSIVEMKLNVLPEYNILIYNQPRITFTEAIVLYMHRRDFDDKAFEYARLYKWIRRREVYNWLRNVHNRNAIERIASKGSDISWNVYEYAEPTRVILTKTLIAIALISGSRKAFEFYNFIKKNIMRLANRLDITASENPLYDAKLPCDYTMTNNLLNPTLLAICASESRGCVESFDLFLNQLHDLDNTTHLTLNISQLKNESVFFSNITAITQTMAKKSRLVRVNGHNFFKATIGLETINFNNNTQNITYNENCILHNFEMIDSIILPPFVAALLTFSPGYIMQ